jgi:imidazole glycerol-phosphate synthase subunit HisH
MRVAIMDTGSGNLRSVEKALARVGGQPTITADPDAIRTAERLVVPGQGAFGEFVRAVKDKAHDLEGALREFLASGRPFLGICLGMQILFDESEEQGPVAGLGLLAGRVVKLRPRSHACKVPHMGWNQVARPAPSLPGEHGEHGRQGQAGRPAGQDDPVLAGIPDGTFFYFVHSYHVIPADPGVVALTCTYDVELVAAVRKDNVFACQFHPEKSQAAGLRLLANFLEAS